MTRRAFVIGHPIGHSRSPLIHGTWIRQYGIDGSYEAIDVAPPELPGFFERIRQGEFVGGNVTLPLKEHAYELCDTFEDVAHGIGAANTLRFRAGTPHNMVHGSNSDYVGFAANLDAGAPGWDQDLKSAIVIGAGGSARAILLALFLRGIAHVFLLNRTREKAEALAADINRQRPGSVSGHGLGAFTRLAPLAGLVVNCSTVGMHGTAFDHLDLELLPRHALVTDIVYTPLETPLLAAARAQGLRTVDGLGMLLHQAVPGFEVWFGVRPEVTPELRRALEATLEA